MKTTKLSFGLLIISLALAARLQAQAPFTNSLVAYYPFTGNANDASGNGHTGTLFGTAAFGVDRYGNLASCLALPGTAGIGSGVDIPSLDNMAYLPVTYSAWFFLSNYPPTPTSGNLEVMTLVGREECGQQSDGAVALFSNPSYNATNNFLYFWGGNGDYGGTVIPPTNKWCQLVVTITSNGTVSIYLDGTNLSLVVLGTPPAGVSEDFRIGASGGTGCGYEYVWNGLIDDVRIYNRALTNSEVAALYAYESAPCTNFTPATATATVVDGFVVSATVTDPGCGYTNTPSVLIVGGGGTGAGGTAVVTNNVVVGITITNAGSGYTNTPAIYLYAPLSISTQPQPEVANAYQTASFSVTALGTFPLTYQWAFNGSNLAGATASSLTISNVVQTNLGTYTVVVTDPFGSITSSPAPLLMPPLLLDSFAGAVTYWGKSASLSVEAWGSALSYQWFDNGVAVAGATNATLNFPSIQLTNAGLYSVVVSSPLASVTNAPELVVVNPAGVSLGLYAGVTISGVIGYNYIIQTTTNLANTNSWVTLTNLTLTQPVQIWVDTNNNAALPGNPLRFYQVLPGQ